MVHEDLKAFLSSNLPSGQTVGIVDPKLLQVVKEEVGCKVQGGEVVQEICRGIRLHMNKFVKALEEKKDEGVGIEITITLTIGLLLFIINGAAFLNLAWKKRTAQKQFRRNLEVR